MKELWEKIREALVSVLPITLIVYLVAFLPGFSFESSEIISFTVGAILLVLGIGFFNLGADIAMTPMGMQKKAQGIVFSLPVSDVAGLAKLEPTEGKNQTESKK